MGWGTIWGMDNEWAQLPVMLRCCRLGAGAQDSWPLVGSLDLLELTVSEEQGIIGR